MFGSQALETAISLALMFFIFASAASAVAEIYAALAKKRAKDLEAALLNMFNTGTLPADVAKVTSADVQAFLKTATGKARSSYLSSKAFADAATELVAKGEHLGGVATRLDSLTRQGKGRLDTAKAGLETWFDQTMAAAQDQYSKRASYFLFATGLVLVVALNASTVNVSHDLWRDAAARQAVVDAAAKAQTVTAECVKAGSVVQQAECNVSAISTFQLPLGWGANQRDGWSQADEEGLMWWLSHVAGWLLSAFLIMLGAPFWFDLLNRLVNLRAGGTRPKAASEDETSYTRKEVADPSVVPPNNFWVPNAEQIYARIPQDDREKLGIEHVSEMTAVGWNQLQSSSSQMFDPPKATDTQDVDWLATALNLGVPMEAVRAERASSVLSRITTTPEPTSPGELTPRHSRSNQPGA